MFATDAINHDRVTESHGSSGVPRERDGQPTLPLWVTPIILIVCIACGSILILYLRRRWKRNSTRQRSPRRSVLLRPVEIRTKAQRPWQQIQLEKLMFSTGGTRVVNSFPSLGVPTALTMNDAMSVVESAYHADMSANSSPCVSPIHAASRKRYTRRSVSDFGIPGRSGLVETPTQSPSSPPPPTKLGMTQAKETPSERKPCLQSCAEPFSSLLSRSQSLQCLTADWSSGPVSRQRSDTDLRRLAMQNLMNTQPFEQASLEAGTSHQFAGKRDGNFIEFEAQYDSHAMRLIVRVTNCYCNRIKRGKSGKKDVEPVTSLFATVCLLPDHRVKYQTRVHYDKTHPQFNEQFTFTDVTLTALPKRRIFVAVYNNEGKTQKPVGACEVPLREVSVTGRPSAFYEELLSIKKSKLKFDPKKLPVVGSGDILISLVYMDYTNKINVIIMKARDLHHPDAIGLIVSFSLFPDVVLNPEVALNPEVTKAGPNVQQFYIPSVTLDSYCDVQLLVTRVKFEHKKTTIRKRTKNPVWNEAFQFDVSDRDLTDCTIAVIVNATDRLTRSYVVGRVDIGCRGSTSAQEQWQRVIENPRRSSAEWHEIRN